MNIWKEMNFAFALGFFNSCRNFHSPFQDLRTVEKLILLGRYSNSHTFLGSSLLLSYFSHLPAGIVMLTSASKGRESCHNPLGTTVACSHSQQRQTAELHIMNQNHVDNWMLCRVFKIYPWKHLTKYSSVQITSPLHGETECSMTGLRRVMDLWAASRFLQSQPCLCW